MDSAAWFLGGIAVVWAVLAAFLFRTIRDQRAEMSSVRSMLGGSEAEGSLTRLVRAVLQESGRTEVRAEALAAIVEGAPIGMLMLDGSGNVEHSNTAADRILSGSVDAATLRSRLVTLSQRVARTGTAEHIEVDVHEPERIVLRLDAVPAATPDLADVPVVIYLKDLSDERRLDAMRTDFVSNASHELKTPLGAMSLLAETLAGTDDDDDRRERLAQRLRDEARRMADVIDDLAQLAQTQALGVEHDDVSSVAVLDDAANEVASLAEERGVDLVRENATDLTLSGSRDELASAVANLLKNAITYSSTENRRGVVKYRTFGQGLMVCFEVEDNGIGIPESYTDRVFERFFRVDRARSRASGGTGLGLSIVKNTAISHGGTVHVTSTIDEGSTFRMCIPLREEDNR